MKKSRILLADDHVLFRAGVRSLLDAVPDFQVVAEAVDGREAVELTRTVKPDVVIMDIAMSGMNGLEATARIKKEFSEIHVIILSMHANEEYVVQALRAGASGYLLKDASISELEAALRAVIGGDKFLSPTISKQVIDDYLRRIGNGHTILDLLTPRQREILQLIAEGKTTKEIADALGISVKTVDVHRSQLMDRLDTHDVAGLVRYAIRLGLVSSDN